jgi:hypothetical protein
MPDDRDRDRDRDQGREPRQKSGAGTATWVRGQGKRIVKGFETWSLRVGQKR